MGLEIIYPSPFPDDGFGGCLLKSFYPCYFYRRPGWMYFMNLAGSELPRQSIKQFTRNILNILIIT